MQEEKKVDLWALRSPLMMHLGVSTVKAVKGWWVPVCPWQMHRLGWDTLSRQSESKELVLCYCPLNTLLPTKTVFGLIPQLTLLQPQLRKCSSKSCVLNSMKKPLWPWIFPPSSDVAGDALFQMLILFCFQTEPF